MWEEGNAILQDGNQYWRVLTLARMATLFYFVLGCVVVYLWTRRWCGSAASLVAVFLFSTLPPVLGHGGLATNDLGCCVTVAFAVYALMVWAEAPTLKHSALLTIAIAIAALTKYSVFFYIPACAAAAILAWAIVRRPTLESLRRAARFYIPRFAAICAVALVLIWGGFRFSVKPLASAPQYKKIGEAMPKLNKLAAVPLPLTELMLGIAQLMHHNDEGHDTYLLGRYSRHGWWYFFPVVLATKTPLGLLMLTLLGALLARSWIAAHDAVPKLAALFCALAVLAVAMSTRINLGVRHLLPIYPFLVIVAANTVVWLCTRPRAKWAAPVAAALLALDLTHSAAAGIDQLAYFNPLAGSHPEYVLCESDLDWGQDLHRLALRTHQLAIPNLSLAYFGMAQPEAAGLPAFAPIDGRNPVSGYVAVSLRNLMLGSARDGSFAWLRDVSPRERIGRTINLYYIPESH
jgi:4-amino-4-deoxy-L-arabinose transferase-like glycosyltransferase